MTTATQVNYVISAPASHHSLWNLMVNTIAKVRADLQHRAAVAKLNSLNDRQLSDIGLSRAEVLGMTSTPKVETSCMRALRQGHADLMSLSYPS